MLPGWEDLSRADKFKAGAVLGIALVLFVASLWVAFTGGAYG